MPIHTPTKAETLVKIGSVGEIGRFLPIISKVQISYTSISGVTVPKFTIFLHDVYGSLAL